MTKILKKGQEVNKKITTVPLTVAFAFDFYKIINFV